MRKCEYDGMDYYLHGFVVTRDPDPEFTGSQRDNVRAILECVESGQIFSPEIDEVTLTKEEPAAVKTEGKTEGKPDVVTILESDFLDMVKAWDQVHWGKAPKHATMEWHKLNSRICKMTDFINNKNKGDQHE